MVMMRMLWQQRQDKSNEILNILMFQRALWQSHRQPAGEPGGEVQPGGVEGQSLRNAESHLPEQRVDESGVGAA